MKIKESNISIHNQINGENIEMLSSAQNTILQDFKRILAFLVTWTE